MCSAHAWSAQSIEPLWNPPLAQSLSFLFGRTCFTFATKPPKGLCFACPEIGIILAEMNSLLGSLQRFLSTTQLVQYQRLVMPECDRLRAQLQCSIIGIQGLGISSQVVERVPLAVPGLRDARIDS